MAREVSPYLMLNEFFFSLESGSYHVFAGKDASKGLGLSSVKPEDAVADYSSLDEGAMNTLDGWFDFFKCVYIPPCRRLSKPFEQETI